MYWKKKNLRIDDLIENYLKKIRPSLVYDPEIENERKKSKFVKIFLKPNENIDTREEHQADINDGERHGLQLRTDQMMTFYEPGTAPSQILSKTDIKLNHTRDPVFKDF